MNDDLTVFIVDDDASVRDALGLLLGLQGWRTASFESADTFLQARKPGWVGCLLLDIRMQGTDGLTLQKQLADAGANLAVVVITGHGDVVAAREAFRNRAIDFLEKPLDHDKLLAAIEEGMRRVNRERQTITSMVRMASSVSRLTAREHQVMQKVVEGVHNRDIAAEFGISVRTVEVHKARMMEKLAVRSVAELVRLYMEHVSGN